MKKNGILRLIKMFLFSKANKEFVVFILFLALSGVFWLFTTLIPLIRDWVWGAPTVVYGPSGLPRQALIPLWGEASWNAYGVFYYFSGMIGYLLLGLYFRKFAPALSWGKPWLRRFPATWRGSPSVSAVSSSASSRRQGTVSLSADWSRKRSGGKRLGATIPLAWR